jgi:pimeloyl-ACP methyl ester carboxylesterase
MIGAPISNEFVERVMLAADGKRESLEAFCRWVMPSIAANHPDEFSQRIDEILLARECYGRMFSPVRAAVMSDDDLRLIATPTVYILGEKDGATADPHKTIARVMSLMPHVETMLIPGAGHDVISSETELLIGRLLEFI